MIAFEGIEYATSTQQFHQLKKTFDLLPDIIHQTRERVIKGKPIPSNEKIVSIFEDHTAVIVKGERDIKYGHKVFVTGTNSGLVSNFMILTDNGFDSEYFIESLDRHKEVFGKVPRNVAADGGFSSEANLFEAQDMGVKNICFSKSPGIAIEEMCCSINTYLRLRKYRAGVESLISQLKRGFGLGKALWKGAKGFARYCHSAVVSHNITRIAQLI